jgi:peptidoglycan/LPS O-acetylase OafA/YrhL
VRDAWSRLGKPQTYPQAWLSAAVLAALLGVCFLAFAIISGWQPPWPQFAILLPAWFLVIGGLRSSYDIRRRRASSRRG